MVWTGHVLHLEAGLVWFFGTVFLSSVAEWAVLHQWLGYDDVSMHNGQTGHCVGTDGAHSNDSIIIFTCAHFRCGKIVGDHRDDEWVGHFVQLRSSWQERTHDPSTITPNGWIVEVIMSNNNVGTVRPQDFTVNNIKRSSSRWKKVIMTKVLRVNAQTYR